MAPLCPAYALLAPGGQRLAISTLTSGARCANAGSTSKILRTPSTYYHGSASFRGTPVPRRECGVAARPTPPSSSSSPQLPRSSPFSSSARSQQASGHNPADEWESLYSSRYKGQGARPERPAWYRSPTLLLLGFMPLFTFGLGVWQVQRLEWKLGLIEELEWKLRKEPIQLPKNINLSVLPSFDFRLVKLSGYFDHSRTMFLGPRVREGVMGYNVVVPLVRDGGGDDVLVDRGFVSEKATIVRGETRSLRQSEEVAPTGHISTTALLPRISPPNYFTPPNEPQRNRWYHADPAEMAEWASTDKRGAASLSVNDAADQDEDAYTPSAGVGSSVKKMLGLSDPSEQQHRVLPVFLEEIFEGYDGNIRVEKGIPVGRAPTIELRNQHSVYAATWFSLSAATAAMFTILVRRRR